jgi:hypothetical protein
LDHDFSVDCDDPALADHVAELLGPLALEGTAPTSYEIAGDRLLFEGTEVVRTAVPGELVGYLVWHVNRHAVALSPRYVLLHAAAASTDGGAAPRAVVLPGPPDAGKTTLVTALVEAGMAYLTDEAVALDPRTGLVVPFPKSLTLGRGAWPLFPHLEPPRTEGAIRYDYGVWSVDPRRIRADAIGGPARPAAVVFPEYRAGAAAECRPLRGSEALTALARLAFNLGDHGPAGFDLLASMVRACRCYRLTAGTVHGARDAVLAIAAS